jgi:hypothetical protein
MRKTATSGPSPFKGVPHGSPTDGPQCGVGAHHDRGMGARNEVML